MRIQLLRRQRPGPKIDREVAAAGDLATELCEALEAEESQGLFAAVQPIGGSSHDIDEIVRPHAERLEFTSQRTDLFRDYRTHLRPDWHRPFGDSGILLETERGKTLTNNMDLLDLWKCHICPEARHLFLIVPVSIPRSSGIQRVFDPVVNRLGTFFHPGNEINVLSCAVIGYP